MKRKYEKIGIEIDYGDVFQVIDKQEYKKYLIDKDYGDFLDALSYNDEENFMMLLNYDKELNMIETMDKVLCSVEKDIKNMQGKDWKTVAPYKPLMHKIDKLGDKRIYVVVLEIENNNDLVAMQIYFNVNNYLLAFNTSTPKMIDGFNYKKTDAYEKIIGAINGAKKITIA